MIRYTVALMTPELPKLTEIRVRGMRALANVALPLDGLTVLIGDNGAGKSTLIEAFEILRKVGSPSPDVIRFLNEEHDGLDALLRLKAPRVQFGVTIRVGGETVDYDFSVARVGKFATVDEETLVARTHGQTPRRILHRSGSDCIVFHPNGSADKFQTAGGSLSVFDHIPSDSPEVGALITALGTIDVRLPFETRPLWLCRERQWSAPLRGPAPPEEVTSLERLGDNLTAAYHSLREGSPPKDWAETLRLIKLGLGDDVVDVKFPPAGRGKIDLAIDVEGVGAITTATLSDGQLTYLAFVAMTRLPAARSALVFDEPDLHLHPELMMRVLDLLEGMSEKHPVVLATHSDRLLDALSEPAKAVVLCRLDTDRATELLRPDPKAFAEWLERYRGLGSLRADGMTSYVMTRKVNG